MKSNWNFKPLLLTLAFAACSSSHLLPDGGNSAEQGACEPACGPGLSCLAGECAPQICSQTAECPAGFSCQAGFCASGVCATPCAPSQICSNGLCLNKNPCGPHETVCGTGSQSYCADLSQDDVNCGSCGAACPSGEVCARGQCAPSCLENETQCGNLCVALQTDGQNCGACGAACPKGQLCSNGQCGATCGSPDSTTCGAAPSAYCADIYISPYDCGGCGTTCGSGEFCTQGICQSRCGGLASQLCDGICVDLQTDLESCGACDSPCKSGQVCYGGECVATCGFPYVTCSAGTASYCADLLEDSLNCGGCGQACAVSQVCSGGVCAAACASGTPCSGICANLDTDNQNCGACGAFCPAGDVCNGLGKCAAGCGVGFTSCGTGAAAYCASLSSDPGNCGACGTLCAGGAACLGGSCADAGVVVDAGATDGGAPDSGMPDSGVNDGGACGGCGPGLVCLGSTCQSQSCDGLACAPGFACVDGGCLQPSCAGVTCPAMQTCANGQCFPTGCSSGSCDAGVCSNGACVEPTCAGITCGGQQVCSAGICQPLCSSGCSAPQVCIGGACQPGCTIDQAVYQAGALNPQDLCQVCDPSADPGDWTNVAGGNACGSGNVCVGAGTCTAGCAIGNAGYAAGAPNPADICQVCNPALSTNGWSAGNDEVVCGPTGEICSGGACLSGCDINGFVAPGTLNPANPCQSCQPDAGVTSYTAVADGTTCQDSDGNVVCQGGVCTSSCAALQSCPSPNDVCQDNVCTEGCLIGGTFYAPGTAAPDGGTATADGGFIEQCCAPNLATGSWSAEWEIAGYGAGDGLVMVAAADLGGFNGSGVVTANATAFTASVVYNNGNGTLSPPAAYNLGISPAMAGVGDINGDGIPDIVALAVNGGSLVVLPGQPGGTFGSPVATGLSYGSNLLGVAAHFFPTGSPGAAIVEQYNFDAQGPLQVYGQGPDGGLALYQSSSSAFLWGPPQQGAQSLVMDLNGDGLDDLAATAISYSPFTTVLLNNAAGNLGNESNYLIGHNPQGLAAASMFGKHFPSGVPVPDLVVFDSSLQQLVVLQNNGNGNFALAGGSPTLAVTSVISVAAGDFNGDGWGDAAILVGGTSDGGPPAYSVQIFFGDGTGNLQPGPSFPTTFTSSPGTGMAMLGGPFGFNGAAGFFSMTSSSTISLWQDACQ